MKKMLVAFIAMMYMAMSCGIAMNIHYCMGQSAGADFYKREHKKCSKCGMASMPGCCNDEHKFYKLNADHKIVSNYYNIATPVAILTNTFVSPVCQLVQGSSTNVAFTNGPPQYRKPPASILYCIFRL